MKKNNSYRYPKTVREMIEGQRHYVLNEEKLPSVTTILSATQSDEKRESLAKWREKMGEEILDNYFGSWAYATKDQLIEELSMVYLEGLTGLRHMDYHEIVKEWNEYQVEDKKDYGDRI